jgi:uroporphyrinogen-III decarboxylase
MLSEQMYRRFVLPYYLRCYDAFPGRRGLHMCGAIDHLIPLLADEMKITHLNGFGSVADPHLLAKHMAGRVVMSGGLDPVLLLQGPVDAIKQQTCHYLDVLAGRGGYFLQDGNNVAPGTLLAHLQAVVDAAEQYVRR